MTHQDADSVATISGIDLARHADFCHNSRCLLCAPDEVRQGIEAVWVRYEQRLIGGRYCLECGADERYWDTHIDGSLSRIESSDE